MPAKSTVLYTILLFPFLLLACKAKQVPNSSEPQLAKDQIMVLLQKKAMPKQITSDLNAYEAAAKGPSSRTENRWIITYNTDLIKPEAMLKKIKAYAFVLEAEFLPVQTDL